MANPIRVGAQLWPGGTPDYRTWVSYASRIMQSSNIFRHLRRRVASDETAACVFSGGAAVFALHGTRECEALGGGRCKPQPGRSQRDGGD